VSATIARFRNKLYCSFCGQSQDDVVVLFAGPQAQICDSCVGECVALIEKTKREADALADAARCQPSKPEAANV